MVDPFTTSEVVDFPVTLGDFFALYEHAAKSPAGDSALKSLQAIS
jgi:hypothetical protein